MKLRLLVVGAAVALVGLLGYWLVPSMLSARGPGAGPRRQQVPKAPISAPTAQDRLNDELRRRTPPAPPRPNPIEELKKIPCRPTGNGVQCKGNF